MVNKLNDKELEFVDKIYPYLKENNGISNSKAAKLSGRPAGMTRRYLLKLVDLNVLTTTGENKNRQYVLVKR